MAERLAKKVLLIGWDAADWKIIHPLLDAGRMPALEGVINHGVMGNLATLDPPLSPMLWTSIATGKHADKHGVLGFTEPRPDLNGIRPVSVTSRKCKALWNILMQNGLKSNVVGWWPSHPAEPIDGVMVSNVYHRTQDRLDQPWPLPPHCIHPGRLEEVLAELRVHPEELTEAHLLPFVPEAARIDQDKDRRLFAVARTIAECASVHAVATWIMENEPWDFMAVYYDAIDHFCHGFMDYHPPRLAHVPEEDFEIYRGVVEGAYRFHNMLLRRLLELAGPETTVILVSDHGFHSDHLRPVLLPDEPAGLAHQHRHYGIVVMKGPHILRDELIFGATLLDIAPTILHLFGLPLGEDMDGHVLTQALAVPAPPQTIPSWEEVGGECGGHPGGGIADELLNDPESLQQLIDLGYIEAPDEDGGKAVADCLAESRFYLARALLNKGRVGEALPILEKLVSDQPTSSRYGLYLADCLESLDRTVECRRVVESIMSREEVPFAELNLLQGKLFASERRFDKAIECLLAAERDNPRLPRLHNEIGRAYLELRFFLLAEKSFGRALEIDPDCAGSHSGLAECFLARGRYREAAEAALCAVGLTFHFPAAHYQLALALQGLGDYKRAAEAGEIALVLVPGYVKPRRLLIELYEHQLRQPAKAAEHRTVLERIRSGKGERQNRPSTVGPPLRTGWARPPEEAEESEELITIVSGLPRSGTSMMMRMLELGGLPVLADGKRAADADNPRGYYEDARVKELLRDNSWLGEARGRAVKVIAQLLPRLPGEYRYRVVFMERRPDEVLRSQEAMLARQNPERKQADRQALAAGYSRQTGRIREWLARQENMTTLFLSYNDIVNDPAGEAGRLNDFFGGRLAVGLMAAAVEPALYRQRAGADRKPLAAGL